jgi:hypothetical protein
VNLQTIFSRVPAAVVDFLRTDETFRTVPMFAITDRGVADQMNLALQGALPGPTDKLGITLVVAATGAGAASPDVPAMWSKGNMLLLTAFEMPVINHDAANAAALGITGADLLASMVAMMKTFQTGEAELVNLNFREAEPVMDFPDVDADTGLVVWRARLLFPGGVQDVSTIVATPVVTSVAGVITITCATAGAAIYYTTDGGRPIYFAAGNAHNVGTPYSAPYSATVGGTVTARAFKAGSRASLLAQHTVA